CPDSSHAAILWTRCGWSCGHSRVPPAGLGGSARMRPGRAGCDQKWVRKRGESEFRPAKHAKHAKTEWNTLLVCPFLFAYFAWFAGNPCLIVKSLEPHPLLITPLPA